jgi:hypothetical protein
VLLLSFFVDGDGDLELDIQDLLARPARDSIVLDLSSGFGSGLAPVLFVNMPLGIFGVAGTGSSSVMPSRTSGLDRELGSHRRRSIMDFLRLVLAGAATCVAVAVVVPARTLVLASFAEVFVSAPFSFASNRRVVLKSSSKSKSKSIDGTSNAGRLGRLLRLEVLWLCWLLGALTVGWWWWWWLVSPDSRSGVECERWKGTFASIAGAIVSTGPFISWRN